MTQDSVDRELSRLGYLPTRVLRRTFRLSVDVRIESPFEKGAVRYEQARLYYGDTKVPPHRACYKHIFAILLFIGRPRKIWSFVDEQISDADLPLAPNEGILRLRRRCLRRSRDRNNFLVCQWKVLAPFLRGLDDSMYSHLKEPKDRILPFTSWEDKGLGGGFGRVYKVKIHSAHHNFDRTKVSVLTLFIYVLIN